MKKILFLSSVALMGFFASCDDDYIDQFHVDETITDVVSTSYVLEGADYATIAGLTANKELALSKDPETGVYVEALKEVGSKKYFTDMVPGEDYIPAFLVSKYPNADLGSRFAVTFNQYQAPAAYLEDFQNITSYSLDTDDYETVWGTKVEASFLSPKTVGKIPALLADAVQEAQAGDMVVVNYAYSDVEPSIGGGSATADPTWTPVATIPVRSEGKSWDFVNMGPVDLSAYKGQKVNIGFKYTSTETTAATWEVKNFKALAVPYLDVVLFAAQEDGSYKKITYAKGFKGAGSYLIAAVGVDGAYYPFGKMPEGKTYGYMYPEAGITVTDGVIAAADAAAYAVTLEATEKGFSMKTAEGKYLYQSGNYDSFNISDAVEAAEDKGYDWTIETAGGADLFTISNVLKGKSVKLNYYKGSPSFGCYAAEKVEGNTYVSASLLGDEGGFTIYNVNDGGLSFVWANTEKYGWKASAFVDNVRYATETYIVSPTIEIAEDAALPYFTIDEAFRYGAAEELQVCVSTDYAAGAAARAVLSRAAVAANASALYVFDGKAWGEYTASDARVAVVTPDVYASVGSAFIAAPDHVLPTFLAQAYPYAEAGQRVAVVYNKKADTPAVAEYTFNGVWAATPVAVPVTVNFTKEAEGIVANMSTYLDETFLGSEGGFTVQNVSLGGLSYVWGVTAQYGWKASAYANNTNNVTEAWIVSPAINFKKAKAPIMTFDEAHRYLNGAAPEKYFGVMISTNYKGDVAAATWTSLPVGNWSDGSTWDFVNVGEIDLAAYIGQTVHIAFKYTSDADAAATWEVKNLKVIEKE